MWVDYALENIFYAKLPHIYEAFAIIHPMNMIRDFNP